MKLNGGKELMSTKEAKKFSKEIVQRYITYNLNDAILQMTLDKYYLRKYRHEKLLHSLSRIGNIAWSFIKDFLTSVVILLGVCTIGMTSVVISIIQVVLFVFKED